MTEPVNKTTGRSKRLRIIETSDGRFFPQFDPGWFWRWRFFRQGSDTTDWFLVLAMEEKDPAKAVQFSTWADADAFLDRFVANMNKHTAKMNAAAARAAAGVQIKRILP